MNAILLQRRVEDYLDTTRNARYQRTEIDDAVNDAVQIEIDEILEDKDNDANRVISFQSEQVISDKLYTLQSTQTATPTNDTALYPVNYYFLTSMFATIAGVKNYVRPTTQNKLGPLLTDSYRAPSDTKPYYLQQNNGFKIYHGAGAITSVELNYLKRPATYTCGKEAFIVNEGLAVLIPGQSYIALEPSVEGGSAYDMGDEFVAATANLTSGSVILTANTTPVDLPERTQQQIAKRAASILAGNTQDYNRAQFAEKQTDKS